VWRNFLLRIATIEVDIKAKAWSFPGCAFFLCTMDAIIMTTLKTHPTNLRAPNPGALIKNSKLRGEWAELRFMTRAAELGIMVSKPWGDSAPYDVMLEHDGRVLRVQVKSTLRIVRGVYRCHVPCNPKVGRKSRAAQITKAKQQKAQSIEHKLDFVAAYVIPVDLWYILPSRLATRLCGQISLAPHRPCHKYAPYLEAWHLLL
jgi:hypothetical protein